MVEKVTDNEDMDKALVYIRRKARERMYGRVTVHMQQGKVVMVTTEETRKPAELAQ